MPSGMHKGPKTRNVYKEHNNDPRVGSNGEPMKSKKSSLERRQEAHENAGSGNTKTVMHRPGSNKK